ncbi:unnamed protein product [Parnassius apollo]|uniref:(apollo) hypothetical protein n=1 Tax=Parnassius apollo TaxID=110799 RepID=A0A8S3XKK8_PARAO|nr:unnamed protein product [Parnassius apollo]
MACNSTDLTSLRIGDDTVDRTDSFRYLGSVLDASGDIDRDIKARISAAWAKWREVTGVICNPKMPVKLKGQVYKTIIRPVLTCLSVAGAGATPAVFACHGDVHAAVDVWRHAERPCPEYIHP